MSKLISQIFAGARRFTLQQNNMHWTRRGFRRHYCWRKLGKDNVEDSYDFEYFNFGRDEERFSIASLFFDLSAVSRRCVTFLKTRL